jgi:adenine specific DNA methylase Mod
MLNSYLIGDNIELLKNLNEQGPKFQLIYFDPPFNTGRDFFDFDDKFEDINYYAFEFLKPRILLMKDLLTNDGVIVVHVEPKVSHYVRLVLDEIFGLKNFQNEIVWKSGGNKKSSKKLMRFHDTILVYSKSSKYKYNPQYLPYDEDYKKKNTVKKDDRGEYTTSAAHNSQPDVIQRPNLRYEWNGHPKQWWWSLDKMKQLHIEDRLCYNEQGIPRVKKYLHEMEGIPVRDLWTDINQIQGSEKLDYATQKPVELLERIVKMYTDENDNVLDPFAGSGTTARACLNLNRNYVMMDINEKGLNIFEHSIIK